MGKARMTRDLKTARGWYPLALLLSQVLLVFLLALGFLAIHQAIPIHHAILMLKPVKRLPKDLPGASKTFLPRCSPSSPRAQNDLFIYFRSPKSVTTAWAAGPLSLALGPAPKGPEQPQTLASAKKLNKRKGAK